MYDPFKPHARLKFDPDKDADFKSRSTSASRPDLLECCVQCSGEMLQVAQGDGVETFETESFETTNGVNMVKYGAIGEVRKVRTRKHIEL